MRLLLTSAAPSSNHAHRLAQLVGKAPKDITLALIENAADMYPADSPGIAQNRHALEDHGFRVETVDLRKYRKDPKPLRAKLASHDVIWLGGGNVYYLRWLLQETGADQYITQLVKDGKVYGGDSAGAVVAGPTLKHFEHTDDPGEAPRVIYDGLGLIDTVIVPHIDNPMFASELRKTSKELKESGYETVLLNEAQALVVNGDEREVIHLPAF